MFGLGFALCYSAERIGLGIGFHLRGRFFGVVVERA